MNIAIISGNLTKDPDSRTTSNGKEVCNFTLGVRRKFKDSSGNSPSDFLPVVCWGKTAELARMYLTKGAKCTVQGSIQTRTYDAQDGTKRYVTEIVAESLEFGGSRADRGDAYEPGTSDYVSQPTVYTPKPSQTRMDMNSAGLMGSDEDEETLPF